MKLVCCYVTCTFLLALAPPFLRQSLDVFVWTLLVTGLVVTESSTILITEGQISPGLLSTSTVKIRSGSPMKDCFVSNKACN